MSVRERVDQPQGFANLATEAWVGLVLAADRCKQEAEAIFTKHGITGDQYNVLRILRGARPRGHPRYEIARRLLQRSPDVTRLLDRLERRNLVERARSEEDCRMSIARITRNGLKLLEQLDPEINDAMREAMAPLSDTQLRQLVRISDLLVS